MIVALWQLGCDQWKWRCISSLTSGRGGGILERKLVLRKSVGAMWTQCRGGGALVGLQMCSHLHCHTGLCCSLGHGFPSASTTWKQNKKYCVETK